MSFLPQVSGKDVVLCLQKKGYKKDRQRGSHIVLRQEKHPHRRIVVLDHKDIAKGTLRAIIKQAGITIDEFNAMLK